MKRERPMYFGSPTLCLGAKDLAASRRFYESLGMEVVEEVSGVRVVLRRGHLSLALFTFLKEAWLNFRGADVFVAFDALAQAHPGLEGAPRHYARGQDGAEADGACWLTRDPGGNAIFFDTNANEQGAEFQRRQLSRLLKDTEQALVDVGASAECLGAFRNEVLARYAAPE
jgi:catechol 2,3-dioxygenase-like lactoylglutathione lyase family enzyme